MSVECDPVPMRYRGIYVQYMYVGFNYETDPNNPAGLTRMKLSKLVCARHLLCPDRAFFSYDQ